MDKVVTCYHQVFSSFFFFRFIVYNENVEDVIFIQYVHDFFSLFFIFLAVANKN